MEKGKIDSSINIEEGEFKGQDKGLPIANKILLEVGKIDLQTNTMLFIKANPEFHKHARMVKDIISNRYGFDGIIIWMPETGSIEQLGVHQLEAILKKLKGEPV